MFRSHCLALGCAAMMLAPGAAWAAGPIKIGFPIPLSGPTAVYGVPILKGAELAVAEINAKGGVLGRKLELLPRDSKANADEAVRLARELIIKDNVDFLAGTLTSAEAPAVSTIAKENKIVFVAPSAKTIDLTDAGAHPSLHLPRRLQHRRSRGRPGRSSWPNGRTSRRVATIAPDYAYGHDAIAAFIAKLKQLRPDIEIVDQQWPKLGEPDFTPFITAQMSKKPDAVYCDCLPATSSASSSRRRRSAISRRSTTGWPTAARSARSTRRSALGADYPYGIWADTYDPVIWSGDEPPAHKAVHRSI